MSFFAACHHCDARHNLGTLRKTGVKLETGTNGYEEDTVSFRCPDCGRRVEGALVTGDRMGHPALARF